MSEDKFRCPICDERMSAPIVQCEAGHSMDGKCARPLENCPKPNCGLSIVKTKRNVDLEEAIDVLAATIKTPCFFKPKGCKYILTRDERDSHQTECRFREFSCEGYKYAQWDCEWIGDYCELEDHFIEDHDSNQQPIANMKLKMNLKKDHKDIKIISFFNGSQYFWYKMKIDTGEKKVFWIFQLIGTEATAKKYYYEFEIHNEDVTRKFKVTEICYNDVTDAEELFRDEKCVCVSFEKIKSFLNDRKQLPIKFRVMALRQPTASSNNFF